MFYIFLLTNLKCQGVKGKKKKNPSILKKKVRMKEAIHKKYKVDKNMKTQATKEHNNQDTNNKQIK
jgi:hypothetical protein